VYEGEIRGSIHKFLDDLKCRDKQFFSDVTRTACCCLLAIPLKAEPHSYDQRYSILDKDNYIAPLFLLVSDAYRKYFWNDLLKYIKEN